jgi:hypothetical protein
MITLEEEWGAVLAAPPLKRPQAPWEDPELSGWVGFYRTLHELLLAPGEFFDNLGEGGWAEPLAFALIVSSAGLLVALFWQFLVLAGGATGDSLGLAASLDVGPGALVGLMAAAPLLVLADLGVGGLCWWGSVALIGADGDFRRAWRIFCYAHGGLALAIIPFLGLGLAGFWILALMYIGAKKVYEVSALRSLGALALFLTIQAALGILFFLGLMVGLAGLGLLALLS